MSHHPNTVLDVDFDALKEQDLALWKNISKVTRFDSGNHKIALSDLAEAYANEILRWYVHKYAPATSKPKQAPDNPVVGTKAQEEEKAKQREKDYDAARRRLRQYEVEQLLLNSGRNRDCITEWINKNVKGYWSAGAVDVAVANLGPRGRNWLEWGKPAPPPPPPVPLLPPAPVEELGVCSDGKPQLPLESPEWVLRKSTPAQIRDWQKRRMAANPGEGIISRGFFGSRHGG